MSLLVYFFFPLASLQQLSVIPLGYVFILFYPLSVVLHLIGFGGVFDSALIEFLSYQITSYQAQIPLWLFVVANDCALLAIRFKTAAILCPLIGILPIFFLN